LRDGGQGPWFTADERRGLLDFWQVYEKRRAHVDDATIRQLRHDPEFGAALAAMSPAEIEAQNDVLFRCIQKGIEGDWSALEARLVERAAFYALAGVTIRAWCEATACFQHQIVGELVKAYGVDPARLAEALGGMHAFVAKVTATVAKEYLAAKERSFLTQTQRAELAVLKFARLAESGILGILVCDLLGNIKEANDSFLDMVGYTRDEVLSGTVRWAEMTPPEWRHLDDEAVALAPGKRNTSARTARAFPSSSASPC
jgi:PAS domain-containing protein